jgi:hypothetical protein
VVETNRYYHQYLDTLDEAPTLLPDMTEFEIFLSLAVIMQMVHIRDSLTDYWSTMEQFYTPFYCNTIRWDRFLHSLLPTLCRQQEGTDKND